MPIDSRLVLDWNPNSLSNFVSPLRQVFNVQMFLVRFPEVDWYSYVLLQTIHIVYNCDFILGFLHSIYTISLFMVMVIRYFIVKFNYIGRQVKCLNASKVKRVDNRRLAKLVRDYNQVGRTNR